jgi:hypothetical protein
MLDNFSSNPQLWTKYGLQQYGYNLRADTKIYEGDPLDLRIDYVN